MGSAGTGTRSGNRPRSRRFGIQEVGGPNRHGPSISDGGNEKLSHAYDIFGDTVNVASRMESNSEPNQINISEDTRKLVEPFYDLIDRGEHSVKGKEDMRMFFVAGIKPELRNPVSPDDETSTGEAFKKKYDAIKGTETSIRQGSPG